MPTDYFFNDLVPVIENCDYAITNLECPIGHHELRPIEKTGPNLLGRPETLRLLKDAGFQLVTLANNHIMDYGQTGLSSTFDF
jgi:poly-gamma-glutamate capsule biosynthesis protein CapA/YwtB (metallophosphatase superfamily)